MNTETMSLDPVELRDQVMAHEEGLRDLVKQLGFSGHFESRCALREAADLLLGVGRSLAAELPPRSHPGRPVRTAHCTTPLRHAQ